MAVKFRSGKYQEVERAMIVFDLKCAEHHTFEAWFRSSADYEAQREQGIVECPFCGSKEISKALMAPNVAAKGNTKSVTVPTVTNSQDPKVQEMAAQAREVLEKVRSHVEDTCDYVGNDFAEEARKIHYGESDQRGIYGESTAEETKGLLDEGIEILPLPSARRTDG